MKNISLVILSTLMLSSDVWANSVTQVTTNSLSQAVLEINAMNAPVQTNMTPAKPYSNESEKNNSLSRAALAIQEAHTKNRSNNKMSYTTSKSTTKYQNSFYGAVLEKQFNH